MKFIVSSVLCLAVIDPFVASEGPLTRYASATKANLSSQGLCGNSTDKPVKQVALGSFENSINHETCDKCIVVKSGNRSTVALVTDRSNKCSGSQITLNEAAYEALVVDDKSEIAVSWFEVKCPNNLSGTGIKFPFHKDSNETWAAFYIVDNGEPITHVQICYSLEHYSGFLPFHCSFPKNASNLLMAPTVFNTFLPFEVTVYGEDDKILTNYRLDPLRNAKDS